MDINEPGGHESKIGNIKSSNMKLYKLNKTFENSIYPIEIELKEINQNTLSSTLGSTTRNAPR